MSDFPKCLVSPDGVDFLVGNAVEAETLRQRGYTEKRPARPVAAKVEPVKAPAKDDK